MRVLVCGSRTFSDELFVGQVLVGIWDDNWNELTVIHGGANGADAMAAIWCEYMDYGRSNVHMSEYRADWEKHGKAAGPIRNQRMLEDGNPDLVLAFVDKPLEQSRGTHDMVKRALKAGKPVYVIQKMDNPAVGDLLEGADPS